MKRWTGAAMLTALVAAGGIGTIDVASAAKIITVPQFRAANAADLKAQRRIHRDVRYEQSTDQPYSGGWTYYYGRPYYYAPAPFPFGFDFGW
jgi:putative NADH-flavin reductase